MDVTTDAPGKADIIEANFEIQFDIEHHVEWLTAHAGKEAAIEWCENSICALRLKMEMIRSGSPMDDDRAQRTAADLTLHVSDNMT